MKYASEFRDPELIRSAADRISVAANTARQYFFMEFCGSHTYAISKYGLRDFLPSNVQMIHGPGCPVCVLPLARLDGAIELARRPDTILTTYGDIARVPASNKTSLLNAKAEGADIRILYSCLDSLSIARMNPDKQVIFFAIGFETTTPPTAAAILEAERQGLRNFSVYCNHVLTPSAITQILDSPEVREIGVFRLDGFIGPAHVSAVIGSRPYEYFAYEYRKPVVIAGFEPADVMLAILMLIEQVNEGRAEVQNEYARAVTREGNLEAQERVAEVFELRPSFEWRGLGRVPYSGLRIKEKYATFDAEKRFNMTESRASDPKACQCPSIIRGVKKPRECKLFGTICTPDHPVGPCMVSSEGACGAYYQYRRVEAVLE